jgi:hypothetical protein
LICPSDSYTSTHRKPIITLAEQYKIPAVFSWREFVTDGASAVREASLLFIFRESWLA